MPLESPETGVLSSRVLLAGLVAATMAWPAAAADLMSQAPRRTVAASAADLFVIADGLSKRGDRRQAERILALLSRDPSRDVRNEARYRRSLLLETAGTPRARRLCCGQFWTKIRAPPRSASSSPRRFTKWATMMARCGNCARSGRPTSRPPWPASSTAFPPRCRRPSPSDSSSKSLWPRIPTSTAPLGLTRWARFSGTSSSTKTPSENPGRRGLPRRCPPSAVARRGRQRRRSREHRSQSLPGSPVQRLFRRIVGRSGIAGAGDTHNGRGRGRSAMVGMKLYQRQLRLSASATRAVDAVSQLRIDASLRHANTLANALLDGRGLTLRAQYERALSPQCRSRRA